MLGNVARYRKWSFVDNVGRSYESATGRSFVSADQVAVVDQLVEDRGHPILAEIAAAAQVGSAELPVIGLGEEIGKDPSRRPGEPIDRDEAALPRAADDRLGSSRSTRVGQ